MNSIKLFYRLFTYDDWANREVLAALKKEETPPLRSMKFFAHIIAAEQLWHSRLKQDGKIVVVWPEPILEKCETNLNELAKRWHDYLHDLTNSKLVQTISYVNSKGEPWTSTVEDILMHVATHSTYHRGQIATDLRAQGCEPAYTDFIHAIRQHLIE